MIFTLKILDALNSGDLVENKENTGGKVKKILFGQQFDWAQFKVSFFFL
jgi:hypothetical protein